MAISIETIMKVSLVTLFLLFACFMMGGYTSCSNTDKRDGFYPINGWNSPPYVFNKYVNDDYGNDSKPAPYRWLPPPFLR